MGDNITQYLALYLAAIVLTIIILIIMVVVLTVKLSRLRNKYLTMINGGQHTSMEDVIIAMQQNVNQLTKENSIQKADVSEIREAMKHMKAKVAIKRYNAFSDHGSDLSFSLALVDEKLNGVVLSGIHSREDSYIYAKPLTKGLSSYNLSPEELEVIKEAK